MVGKERLFAYRMKKLRTTFYSWRILDSRGVTLKFGGKISAPQNACFKILGFATTADSIC